jgi:penicillin-binding protein 1A
MRKRKKLSSLYLILIGGLVTGLVCGGVLGYWSRNLPPVESLEFYRPDIVTQIFDNKEQVIAEFFTERRIVLQRNEIPKLAIGAVLGAEDAEFYSHSGFDMLGIFRAVLKDIISLKKAQGGSTITQQLSRLLFLTNEKTFMRKIKEALLTVKIEQRYSKDEILMLYLNQSYFGQGAYGIESAARTYFDKSISELTCAQCALLACVLKNPAYFNPLTHPDRALESRNRVLRRMQDAGFISEKDYEQFLSEPLDVVDKADKAKIGPYFVEEIRKTVVDQLGNERVLTGGLKIAATLDRAQQMAAESAVGSGIQAFMERHKESEDIQAALVAIRPNTGEITAMVGGSDFSKTKFNRAVQAKRQSGSAIKPFIYYSALQNGFKPTDIIMDEPVVYKDPQTKREWAPLNYDRKFHGPTTLRTALEQSYNVVTVKLLDRVGVPKAMDIAHRAGIESELPPYLSFGLGSGEVSLLELTNAFATLSSEGLRCKPRYMLQITDERGTLLEKFPAKIEETLDKRYCYMITRLLEGSVERGTCWRAKSLNRPVAAKTGTTDQYTDAWFIGYTPSLAAGVWIGYDLKKTMGSGETGSQAAGPIFVRFMEQVFAGTPIEDFAMPEGCTEATVCQETGFLANSSCPNRITEVFIDGTAPRKQCPVHSP